MDLIILLVLIALIWVFFASIFDLKTREVPDWLNYSLIIIGITFFLINYIIKKDIHFLINPFFGFAIGFLIANIMYYSKQWGGGDAKLLMAIGLIFYSYPESLLKTFNPNINFLPFILVFLLNLVIIGAIYGILWAINLGIKNNNLLKKEFKAILRKNIRIRKILVMSVLILLLLSFLLDEFLRIFIFITVIISLFLLYLSLFIKSVENSCMFKKITIDKLTEGDWVVDKIIINNNLVYTPRNIGISKEDIENLKKYKNKINYVTIKEGIPFVPSFFISLIISLVFGNIVLFFI